MTPHRPCEVLLEDGSWSSGTVIRDAPVSERGVSALVACPSGLVWMFRDRGLGLADEWRESP